MAKKTASVVYVYRNGSEAGACYTVSRSKRLKRDGFWGEWGGGGETFCSDGWHAMGLPRLKPGEGPVKLEVRRVEA